MKEKLYTKGMETISLMNDFIIRNPKDEDAERIERMNREEEIVAVAHLMEHATFHAAARIQTDSRL